MKRIFCVGATMVAMGALASPAAAEVSQPTQGRSATAPNCEKGIITALAASQNRSARAQMALARNLVRCLAPRTGGGGAPVVKPPTQGRSATAPNCEKGIITALAASQNRSARAQMALARNLVRCLAPRTGGGGTSG